MDYNIKYSCISHTGNIRLMNQDNFYCNGRYMSSDASAIVFPINGEATSGDITLFAIFDGMGGEECGEVASYIAAKVSSEIQFSNGSVDDLKNFCKDANHRICSYSEENSISSMGTTAAMLLFSKKYITLCNIGDSKVFRFSAEGSEQISEDHVAVSAFGKKPPLLQNLGIPPEELLIDPFFSKRSYIDGDKYLICSDGLTDMVSMNTISKYMLNQPPNIASRMLVDKALEKGGKDNITVIAIEIKKKKSKIWKFFTKRNGGRKL